MYGLVVGQRHDVKFLRQSGWETQLIQSRKLSNRHLRIWRLCLYTIRPLFMRPFIGNTTNEHHALNTQMSAVRVAVEHSYKDLKLPLISRDFAQNLKL